MDNMDAIYDKNNMDTNYNKEYIIWKTMSESSGYLCQPL